MKNLAISILLSLSFTSCSFFSMRSLEEDGPVTFKDDAILIQSNRLSREYTHKDSPCKFAWEVNQENKNDSNQEWFLRLRYFNQCHLPWESQLYYHKTILEEVFKRHLLQKLSSIGLESLSRMDPTHSWQAKAALACASLPSWIEFQQTPTGKPPRISSNQIFVEAAIKGNALSEIENLFNYFTLSVKLESVEKVFVHPVVKLLKEEEIIRFRLRNNQKVCFDAGMLYLKIIQNK